MTAANPAATRPPIAMAGSTGMLRFTSAGYISGTPMLFTIGAVDRMPDAYAPTPTKPMCVHDRMPELPMNTCSPNTMIKLTQKYV
jgi:hypothetical protein